MARPYCELWNREIDEVAPSGLFFLGGVAELKLGAEDNVPLARHWFCAWGVGDIAERCPYIFGWCSES